MDVAVAGEVYHLRPEAMVGTTLWPLSALAAVSESAYAQAASRYDDRPGLTRRRVVALDCTWADCVFLCPVHPTVMRDAILRGRPRWPQHDWLAIDASRLAPAATVLYHPRGYGVGSEPPPVDERDCEPWTAAGLEAASRPSPDALARLADPAQPGLFAAITHVLHRGPLAIDPDRIVRA